MPHAHVHEDLDAFIAGRRARQGLLGQHARLHREPPEGVVGRRGDRRERLLLRLPAAADRQPQHLRHRDGPDRGTVKGYFLFGQNPAVGSANTRMQRLGMSKLDWLVVRDFSLIESATWWKDGPEIESGEMRTEDIATEVFFLPGRRAHREGRHVHEHPADAAVAPQGRRAAGRPAQRPLVHLPPRPADPRAARRLDRRRATGRCSTSPGTTRPRARTTSRAPTRCCARSTAGTPTARCSAPTPS